MQLPRHPRGASRASVTRQTDRGRNFAPWWPSVCVLAVIVVSEFQFRVRGEDEAVSGRPDLFVLLEVATYAGVGAFVLLRFRPRPRRRRPDDSLPAYALGYGFGCVLILSAVYSPYLSLAMVRAGQVLVVLVLFTAIMRHAGPAAMHRVAHVYCVLLTAAVLFGVLMPLARTTQPERFTWLHVHPVQAGEMLAIAVVLLVAYLVTHRLDRAGPRWPLPVYLALLATCAGGLVATQTRGAVFGAVAGTAVVVWTRWRGTRKVEVGALGAVVLVLLALTSRHAIGEFVTRGESPERLATLNARTELWTIAMEQVARHPLYGSGLAASRGVFLDAMGLGGGHNALVNLLVDTGLVGGVVWLALLVTIGAAAVRLVGSTSVVRVDGIIVLSVLCGMVANSVFTEELGTPANAAFTWLYLLLAWVVVAGGTARRHRDRPVR